MKILFDQNVSLYLADIFSTHEVSTAYREGWSEVGNGALLTLAQDAGFALLLTLDRSVQFQQNMTGRRISVAVLAARSDDRAALENAAHGLALLLGDLGAGQLIVVPTPS